MSDMSDKKELSLNYLVRAYAWPFRKVILALILMTLLSNLVTTIQPVALSGVMNIIVQKDALAEKQKKGTSLNLNHLGSRVMSAFSEYSDNKWHLLLLLLGIYVSLVILSTSLNYCAYLISMRIEARAVKLITSDLLRHLFSLNMGFFNREKSGELMSRLTSDVRDTANAIGPLVRSFFHHSILIVVYSAYLISTSFLLSIGALLLIFTQFVLTELIKRPVRRTIYFRAEKRADFLNTLHEILTSVRVIKSFGSENYELNKSDKDVDVMVKADIKVGAVKDFGEQSRSILDAFAMTGIVVIAFQQLMKGSLSLPGFALYIYVGQLLVTPINKLAVNVSWIQALLASYSRINDILQIKPSIIEGSISKSDFNESIEVKGLSFSYGSNLVLEDVSFEVKKEEVIAVVGPSGAGKSTLVDLIMRFYDPLQGSIYIDGVNLKELKYDDYRKIFGVVSQQNILFNDSVRNNIAYGRTYLGEEEIFRAAKIANAHDFIMGLPNGYDTVVGEKGVLLSGGQCQRIAIARAVVDRPHILIFDEATSSLDSESERQVQVAIDKVLETSTAIIIAHRLSTILHADKIIVLQKGKIEAIGAHKDLLSVSATYKLLYNLQFQRIYE